MHRRLSALNIKHLKWQKHLRAEFKSVFFLLQHFQSRQVNTHSTLIHLGRLLRIKMDTHLNTNTQRHMYMHIIVTSTCWHRNRNHPAIRATYLWCHRARRVWLAGWWMVLRDEWMLSLAKEPRREREKESKWCSLYLHWSGRDSIRQNKKNKKKHKPSEDVIWRELITSFTAQWK